MFQDYLQSPRLVADVIDVIQHIQLQLLRGGALQTKYLVSLHTQLVLLATYFHIYILVFAIVDTSRICSAKERPHIRTAI